MPGSNDSELEVDLEVDFLEIRTSETLFHTSLPNKQDFIKRANHDAMQE
jgi:hypothetical protein